MYFDKKFRKAEGRKENTVTSGNVRLQFITDRLLRMEWQEKGHFEDRQTLAVVNRDTGKVKISSEKKGKGLIVKSPALTVEISDTAAKLSADTVKISFKFKGKTVAWKPGMADKGNLGSTIRTLDGMQGACKMARVPSEHLGHKDNVHQLQPVDLGKGFLSRDGWSLIDDSKNIVIDLVDGQKWVVPRPEGERQDFYFIAYGHDYAEALADCAKVFGTQPLPPRYTLGYWWSRYWAYSDTQIEELVKSFRRMDLPIDVMVIDMDWHKEGWTGYSWDKRYFSDPAEHLAWLHKNGVKATLNLHPADGVGKHEDQFEEMCKAMDMDPKKTDRVPFDITSTKYMNNYFKVLHHPDEKRGIDFWWMDWQQGESTAMKGLDTLPWINQLHWEDMEGRKDREGKRPLIFSRFGGYGSGRYNIGFSGDTFSTWESLAFQPYFTATAANVLYGYWSHDIGGHMPGAIEPELYTRWIQYGIYSPILRTHTTKNPEAERRVWEYPAPYNEIMMNLIRQRYSMVPYIYTENRKAYDTAISLCRPMYYSYPEENNAYKYGNQYMFGGSMIVAPVVSPCDKATEMAEMEIWLPEGEWFDTARGSTVKGGRVIKSKYLINEIPVFVRPGTVIPGQKDLKALNEKYYKNLLMTVYGGKEGSYELYVDDGISMEYLKDEYITISMSHKCSGNSKTIKVVKSKGKYKGYVAERSLEVRLEASIPPSSVKIGKKSLSNYYRIDEETEGWGYDAYTGSVIIKVASFNLDKGIEIVVDYPAKADFKAAEGMRGNYSRLNKVNELDTFLTSYRILHQDERLSQELYQSGNRISRNPESFNAEMKQFASKVERLKEATQALSVSSLGWHYDEAYKTRIRRGKMALAILDDVQV